MKSFTLLCLCALAAAALAKPADKHYTNRFDNINLDEILQNRRLLVPYLKCILEQGKCSPDGKELKTHLREALEENCSKCTETQRKGSRRVIAHIINHEAEYWTQLKAKYDPSNKYTVKYEQDLKTLKA